MKENKVPCKIWKKMKGWRQFVWLEWRNPWRNKKKLRRDSSTNYEL